jgi:hypothetical protein
MGMAYYGFAWWAPSNLLILQAVMIMMSGGMMTGVAGR